MYKNMEINIVQGDCLEEMPKISSGSIDMILCDLPYGLTKCTWDITIPLDQLWSEYKRLIKPTGAIVMTASQPFTSVLIASNIKMYKHEIIWVKNRGSNFANTVREPMKEHESVLIFAYKKWTYNKQMQSRTGGGITRIKYDIKWDTQSENYRQFEGRLPKKLPKLRVPSSIQKFNVEVGLHPTQKPVALFEYLIKTYSNPGEMILDNCAGSGTTGVACLNTRRKAILIEQEEKYIKIINTRISNRQKELDNELSG